MRHAIGLLLFIIMAAPLATGASELTDHGPQGVAFHEDFLGRYYLDPAVFLDASREQVQRFLTYSGVWYWCTSTDVDFLLNATPAAGFTLEEVMGPRQSTVGGGGPRWLGFDTSETPDGYLIQAGTPPYNTLDTSDTQAGTASLTHGAWVAASFDPETYGRLDHLGSSDEPFFHDQATGLYWCDPETFVGMGRTGVESWLTANPDWRWATLDEVWWLLGKFTVGDVPLVDVLGAPQVTVTGDIPRWVGYCSGTEATEAPLVQAGSGGIARPMLVIGDMQAGADDATTGAWIVSETSPTPVATRSLTEVKALFQSYVPR